jgi:hypothetical protein
MCIYIYVINRLVRLVHGPSPSAELTQLLRCLRCSYEPHSMSSTSPASFDSKNNKNGNKNKNNAGDTPSDGKQEQKQDPNKKQEQQHKRRLLLHDDESSTIAERWSSICWLLLKFPILIQPIIHLQKALIRKTMGDKFWLRMSKFRKVFPLPNRRVMFPVLTAQRILAAVALLQEEVDSEDDIR